MKFFIIIALMSSLSCSSQHKHSKHHNFSDAAKWSKIFESKKRDEWQRPELIFSKLKIKKTDLIADIGSATGYFPIRLAPIVREGRVWGVDIEPSLVNYLNARARKEKLDNLFSVLGTFSDALIPEPVDIIFIVNTFHHISNRHIYLSKLRKSLKTNGRIVIIDFKKGKLPFGPKDKMKISKENIIKELKSSNYSLVDDFNILEYQNFLVFN